MNVYKCIIKEFNDFFCDVLLVAFTMLTCTRGTIILADFVFLLEQAESAIIALNCSGMLLGTQPIRFGAFTEAQFLLCKFQLKLVDSYLIFILILQGESFKDSSEAKGPSSGISLTDQHHPTRLEREDIWSTFQLRLVQKGW